MEKVDQEEKNLKEMDMTPIFIALFVVLITFVVFFLWRKRSSSRSDIILSGLCDSGKTFLFEQLLYSQNRETFTSISENIGFYKSDKGTIRVVDIPGHERLRSKYIEQYKPTAKGIVFVVDSVTFQKDLKDVADYLYTLLTDKTTSSAPLLVLCNKQDETMAKGSKIVKSLLEKELNLVRTTRTSQLQSVDNSASNAVFLGKSGKDFEFSQLSQNVNFIEGSAQKKQLKDLCSWLDTMI